MRKARHRMTGFSLIELMVAIALGLLLMLVMTRLMAQQSSARAEIERSGRQIENGRYAVNLLREDIQLAGYYGQVGGVSATPASLPDPCETGATPEGIDDIADALAMPIQGYDSPASLPAALAACLNAANHIDGTDILMIRRSDAEDDGLLPAATVAGHVYLQTTPADLMVGLGGSGALSTFNLMRKDAVTPAELRRYVARIYFVSPCNVPSTGDTCDAAADNGRPIPTLKRLDLGAGSFTVTPLVEGVENLQFEYGIDASGDGSPDSYSTAPDLAQWPNVVAVRIGLLSRATEPSPGHVDDRRYEIGDVTIDAPGDAYKRQAYSVAVRAVNPSGRRE